MFNEFILLEDFKTALAKWLKVNPDGLSKIYMQAYIERFRMLKDNQYILPPDNNIDTWAKGKFSDFSDFVEKKHKEYERKKNAKNLINYNKTKVKKIFENDNALVLVPLTPDASENLSSINGTNHWCIASSGASRWWNDYIGKQGLTPYYVFFKADMSVCGEGENLDKVAVMINVNNQIDSIWNKPNRDIYSNRYRYYKEGEKPKGKALNIIEILKHYGIPVETFKSLVSEEEGGSQEMPDSEIDSIIDGFQFDWDNPMDDLRWILQDNHRIDKYLTQLKSEYIKYKTPKDKQLDMDDVFDEARDAGYTSDLEDHYEEWIGNHELEPFEEEILDELFKEVSRLMENAYNSAYDSALESEIEYQRENYSGGKYTLDPSGE